MKKQLVRDTLLLILTCALLHTSGAAVLLSTISQSTLSVGDRVTFTVSAITPKNALVTPPDPSSFGSIIVKEWNSKKYPQTKADSTAFTYVLTTYTAENCTIPSLPYVIENGTAHDTLTTERLPLTVIPLCKADSADIMDLKPQQVTGKAPLLWLWIVMALALLTAGYYFVRKYRKKKSLAVNLPPPLPPYEEAIAALAALDEKKYLMKGMVREYAFELSDILKRYIERRFAINAAEFTTEEMFAWLGISPLDKPLRTSMEWFFRATDPVKFARHLPDSDTIARFDAEVRAFLSATRPKPEPVTAATATATPADAQKASGGAE